MADAAVLDAPQVDAPAAAEPAVAPAEPEVVWAPDPRLAPKPAASAPAPSGEAPSDESPAATESGEGEASKPDPGSAKAEIPSDWKAKLEAGDPEFLADFENHPKVKGFIAGRAAFIAQQERDALAKAAANAEKDQAARDDPDNPLSKAHLAERQKETEANQAAVAHMAGVQAAQEGVAAFLGTLTPEARAEIAKLAPEGKAYGQPGDITSGLAEYMADVTKGVVAAEIAKAKVAWEKETLPGLRKEVQAELMISDRTPDLGVGASSGAGAADGLTPEKYARLTPTEMHKLTSTPAGRARIDAMWAANP